jgi:protein-S-isoprenylcysteine O-methyltransferase Ste14
VPSDHGKSSLALELPLAGQRNILSVWRCCVLWFYKAFFPVVWIVFLLYWQIKAFGTKTTQRIEPLASRILRVLIFLIAIVLLSTTRIPLRWLYLQPWPTRFWPFWLGAGLMVAGLLFAVWAREHLGRNWSRSVTIKEDHELINSGPYAVVRHPIYTGILAGFLGTAIAVSEVRGYIAFALVFLALWLKLRMEEQWMRSQFGETYATYTHKTAALVPYLF